MESFDPWVGQLVQELLPGDLGRGRADFGVLRVGMGPGPRHSPMTIRNRTVTT